MTDALRHKRTVELTGRKVRGDLQNDGLQHQGLQHVELQDEGLHQDSYITATELFDLKVQICR